MALLSFLINMAQPSPQGAANAVEKLLYLPNLSGFLIVITFPPLIPERMFLPNKISLKFTNNHPREDDAASLRGWVDSDRDLRCFPHPRLHNEQVNGD